MEEEISYFSIELLNSMYSGGEPNRIESLVEKIEKVDPEGRRAHEISDRIYKSGN